MGAPKRFNEAATRVADARMFGFRPLIDVVRYHALMKRRR